MITRAGLVAQFTVYACTALFALPLVVMAATAVRPDAEVLAHGVLAIPVHPSFDGLRRTWDALSGSFAHTLGFTLTTVAISVSLGALTGAALVARTTGATRILTGILVLGLFIPPQVIL